MQQKWEVLTSMRRPLTVFADTADEAIQKGQLRCTDRHGHVTLVRPIADDYESVDTMGD